MTESESHGQDATSRQPGDAQKETAETKGQSLEAAATAVEEQVSQRQASNLDSRATREERVGI